MKIFILTVLNISLLVSCSTNASYEDVAGIEFEELKVLKKVMPRYRSKYYSHGIEGYSIVEFTVNEKGRVQDAKIVYSEPSGLFETDVLKSTEKWRYKPRIVNGKATKVEKVSTYIQFCISGDGEHNPNANRVCQDKEYFFEVLEKYGVKLDSISDEFNQKLRDM